MIAIRLKSHTKFWTIISSLRRIPLSKPATVAFEKLFDSEVIDPVILGLQGAKSEQFPCE